MSAVLENVETAKAGMNANTSCDPDKCVQCKRVGLNLLLVRPSVIDSRSQGALSAAGLSFPAALDAKHAGAERKGTSPVARLLRAGFVYVFYPKTTCWDLWRIFDSGTTALVMRQVSVAAYEKGYEKRAAATKQCSLGAANLPAHLISIFDAENQPSVRIAYADHLWTPEVLKHYSGSNPDGRLLELSVSGWVTGGALPASGATPLTEASLKKTVIEFAPVAGELKKAFADAPHPLIETRLGHAKKMEATVRGMEKPFPKLIDKTLIVCVQDIKGLCDDHNSLRQRLQMQEQLWLAGEADVSGKNTDPLRPWKRQSTLHVAYVREWARINARNLIKQRAAEIHNGPSNAPIPKERFDQMQKQGLYPPDTTWKPIVSRDGKPHPRGLGRVVYSEEHIAKTAKHMGSETAQGRFERYGEKVKLSEMEAFNKLFVQQQGDWHKHLIALDTDYVKCLKQPLVQTFMDCDFNKTRAMKCNASNKDELDREMREAHDKLAAVESLLGGGGVTEVSHKFLVEQLKKDENDPKNWIASAIVNEFDFFDELTKPQEGAGMRADIYDAWSARRASWSELVQGWQMYSIGGRQLMDNLLLVAQQTTQKMIATAAAEAQAGNRVMSAALTQATQKNGLWVTAGAMIGFLSDRNRHYVLKVLVSGGEFADMLNAGTDRVAAAVLGTTDGMTGKQQRKAIKRQRRTMRQLATDPHFSFSTTMHLAVDEAQLARMSEVRAGKTFDIVGFGPTGQPATAPTKLPQSLAEELVVEQRVTWAEAAANARANKRVFGSGVVVFLLQAWALGASLSEFSTKAGSKRAEALAASISAATGIFGAVFEVGAMMMTPSALAAGGTPAASTLATKIPRYLWWRCGAGAMMAAGAIFDGVAAVASWRAAAKKGDSDAAALYAAQGVAQFSGGVSLGVGTFFALRSAVLNRAIAHGAVRVGVAAFAGVAFSSALASWWTGIGLVLWIAGMGIGIVAKIMEDDENEDFLERTHFGIGGQGVTKFTGLDEEYLALSRLAFGLRAEIEWDDKWFDNDKITVNFHVVDWDSSQILSYTLEAFDKMNGRSLGIVYSGPAPETPVQESGMLDVELSQKHSSVLKFSQTHKLTVEAKALKLSYKLAPKIDRPERQDAKLIASDVLWADDSWF